MMAPPYTALFTTTSGYYCCWRTRSLLLAICAFALLLDYAVCNIHQGQEMLHNQQLQEPQRKNDSGSSSNNNNPQSSTNNTDSSISTMAPTTNQTNATHNITTTTKTTTKRIATTTTTPPQSSTIDTTAETLPEGLIVQWWIYTGIGVAIIIVGAGAVLLYIFVIRPRYFNPKKKEERKLESQVNKLTMTDYDPEFTFFTSAQFKKMGVAKVQRVLKLPTPEEMLPDEPVTIKPGKRLQFKAAECQAWDTGSDIEMLVDEFGRPVADSARAYTFGNAGNSAYIPREYSVDYEDDPEDGQQSMPPIDLPPVQDPGPGTSSDQPQSTSFIPVTSSLNSGYDGLSNEQKK